MENAPRPTSAEQAPAQDGWAALSNVAFQSGEKTTVEPEHQKRNLAQAAFRAVDRDETPSTNIEAARDVEQSIRDEKLKKGIKIVIGGPPHSGKSILTTALKSLLKDLHVWHCTAAPDGEYPGLEYDNKEAKKQRKKGDFSPEFVAHCAKKIEDWVGPVALIDIGGMRSEENEKIIKSATHAIIVAGSYDGRARRGERDKEGNLKVDEEGHSFVTEFDKWKKFFEDNHLEVIAQVQSDLYSKEDHVLGKNKDGIFRGSIHRLKRVKKNGEEKDTEKETAIQIANLIREMVANNHSYEGTSNPFYVEAEDFYKGMPTYIDRDGNDRLKYEAIPSIYKKARQYNDRPTWIKGNVTAWQATTTMIALMDAKCEDPRIHGEDGDIQLQNMRQTEKVDPKWWGETRYQGEKDGKPVYVIKHLAAAHSGVPINPSVLKEATVPKLPKDSIVILDSGGPTWLKSSIAASYRDTAYAVGLCTPGHNSVIVWSRDRKLLGGGPYIRNKTTEHQPEKTPKELANYLKAAKRNLEATSSTSQGIEEAIRLACSRKDYHFQNTKELRNFTEEIAKCVNNGKILIRKDKNTPKHPYVSTNDLPKAIDNFYNQLLSRLNNPNVDPVETAAFVEYAIDMSGHFFAGDCSGAAKAMSAFVLMRANHTLPDYSRGQNQYYSYSPRAPQGTNVTSDKANYRKFVAYYKTLFK